MKTGKYPICCFTAALIMLMRNVKQFSIMFSFQEENTSFNHSLL